jgi:methylmalonyl-CoA epimerase
MLQQFDHVGIVVKDTDESLDVLNRLFQFEIMEKQEFPEQGFKSTLISKEKVIIELIEPIGENGIIHNFVKKKGYGLHHISLRVKGLSGVLGALAAKDVQLIDEQPQKITDTSQIAFLHPASTAGILIELMERDEEGK